MINISFFAKMFNVVSLLLASNFLCCEATGQDTSLDDIATAIAKANHAEPVAGNRWMVLICGMPGDEEHRTRLTAAVTKIAEAASPVFNVDKDRLMMLVGDETMQAEVSETNSGAIVCNSESVAKSLRELSLKIQPTDACMVILLGHAHLYGGRSTFNVQGKDFDATELATWTKPILCRERVFWITTPVSGFWLKPLSGPSTVVVSATEPDLEFTGTEMPYALADVLSGDAAVELKDVDEDGQLSLLDLYLTVNLEVHQRFKSAEQLQTEHAQLEDNADGIGKELQIDFLPVDTTDGQAIEPSTKPRNKIRTTNSDGDLARLFAVGPPTPKNPANPTPATSSPTPTNDAPVDSADAATAPQDNAP